jgi:hypothetical protein
MGLDLSYPAAGVARECPFLGGGLYDLHLLMRECVRGIPDAQVAKCRLIGIGTMTTGEQMR